MTRAEQERALEAVKAWPKAFGREVLQLPKEERDLMLLLAGELGAVPVDADGWPIRDRPGSLIAAHPSDPSRSAEHL